MLFYCVKSTNTCFWTCGLALATENSKRTCLCSGCFLEMRSGHMSKHDYFRAQVQEVALMRLSSSVQSDVFKLKEPPAESSIVAHYPPDTLKALKPRCLRRSDPSAVFLAQMLKKRIVFTGCRLQAAPLYPGLLPPLHSRHSPRLHGLGFSAMRVRHFLTFLSGTSLVRCPLPGSGSPVS